MNAPIIAAALALSVFSGNSKEKQQEKPADKMSCPMHEQRKASQGVVERGDKVMGFSHEKTRHHFRLYSDGGAIEAESNDSQDATSRDEIRSHFRHIAKMFAAGDFSSPMLIHAQNPPGTEAMKRLRDSIQYNVEDAERGTCIRITTKNPEALQAVHRFLRFQIADHQTGDATEIAKVP